jgi:hypothetical protein
MDKLNKDKFTWKNGELQVSICPFCVHKHPGQNTCDAFILGIPDRFLNGSHQHTSKTPGDRGIIYEEGDFKPPKGLVK